MLIETVKRLVQERPGSTATQLAAVLYGKDGYSERINPTLRVLCRSGHIERQGSGGPRDPYRYFPVGRNNRELGP